MRDIEENTLFSTSKFFCFRVVDYMCGDLIREKFSANKLNRNDELFEPSKQNILSFTSHPTEEKNEANVYAIIHKIDNFLIRNNKHTHTRARTHTQPL